MPFNSLIKRKEYEKRRNKTPERIAQRKKYRHSFNGMKTRRKYEISLQGKKSRRDYQLKNRCDSSIDEYNALFKAQSGKCAICKIHQSELRRSLDLDHNHKTGKIRGLLCRRHNSAVGFFRDSLEELKKAVEYLKKYEDKI